jgi:hypothetical protein
MTQDVAALIQIGQLLTKSGILTHEDLSDALQKAKERNLPIGTVLLMMGCIRQQELRAAVEAQSMINDKVLSLDTAVVALIQVFSDGCPLDEALKAAGWKPAENQSTNKLGELLLDAEMLTKEQLAECLSTGKETGMPLGKVLVFRRTLSDPLLLAVLSAQRLIREGMIARDQAIKGLRAVRQRKITLEESLAEGGFYKPPPKKSTPLGYLLVEAGFIKQDSLMMCMELSLSDNKPIDEVLIEHKFVTKEIVDAASRYQSMVERSTSTRELAAAALRLVQDKSATVDAAIAQAGMPRIAGSIRNLMQELLVLSGLVEPKEMPKLQTADDVSYELLMAQLKQTGVIADHMANAVVRALYLIDRKLLSPEDAVMALHHCRKMNTDLDEALLAMGWKTLAHRKS